MKCYKIYVKHVLEPEWSYRGIFTSDSFDDIVDKARMGASFYYENLAEKYELPNLESIINVLERFTAAKYGETLPADEVDSVYWSYLNSIMEYKIIEI